MLLLFILEKVCFLVRENPEKQRNHHRDWTQVGTPQPTRPATTTTHRTTTLTTQTRTLHRTTRRRTRKNTQRNTRQTNNHRKQTQNNRRTTQNKTLSVARKKSGFDRENSGEKLDVDSLLPIIKLVPVAQLRHINNL